MHRVEPGGRPVDLEDAGRDDVVAGAPGPGPQRHQRLLDPVPVGEPTRLHLPDRRAGTVGGAGRRGHQAQLPYPPAQCGQVRGGAGEGLAVERRGAVGRPLERPVGLTGHGGRVQGAVHEQPVVPARGGHRVGAHGDPAGHRDLPGRGPAQQRGLPDRGPPRRVQVGDGGCLEPALPVRAVGQHRVHRVHRDRPVGVREAHRLRVPGDTGLPADLDPGRVDRVPGHRQQHEVAPATEQPLRGQGDLLGGRQVDEADLGQGRRRERARPQRGPPVGRGAQVQQQVGHRPSMPSRRGVPGHGAQARARPPDRRRPLRTDGRTGPSLLSAPGANNVRKRCPSLSRRR